MLSFWKLQLQNIRSHMYTCARCLAQPPPKNGALPGFEPGVSGNPRVSNLVC